jgi:hypothetical protein
MSMIGRNWDGFRIGVLLSILTPLSACAPASSPTGGEAAAPTTEESAGEGAVAGPGQAGAEGTVSERAAGTPPDLLPEDELANGWISLFDGHSLFGWQRPDEANWRVEDGAIKVDSGEKCLLCTSTEFSDYELKIDFRCPQTTNSGVFLHTAVVPTDPAQDCYELNIAGPDNPFPTGSLVFRQRAQIDPVSPDWHSYHVTLDGARITVLLDGQQILEYEDPRPLGRGPIGLQFNTGEVAFRNIHLRPLRTESIFNGKDLSGWKTYPEMASEFTVTETGEMNVRDGRGQLETEASYGDFILQLECMTHAERLNSGVFFRCIPGDTMMGYECQIQNGFENGDRTQPEDCGTGGFFRRQDARYVVADDLDWFHLTLVADGPHMAAWVDGYQVSDWTDDREPHENPRKGLRLEPGTLMIQGHDPTTNLSFRNLRIAPLATRQEAVATVTESEATE